MIDGGPTQGQHQHRYLHLHCLFGTEEDVRKLIEAGRDVNALDGRRKSPLHLAVVSTRRPVEKAKALLDAGALVDANDMRGHTPLHLASDSTTTALARHLIAFGADVDARDERGRAPLHFATNGVMVGLLTLAGAEIDARDGSERTPLHVASMDPFKTAVVRELLARGAKVEAIDNSRSTPLHLACERGSEETVRSLLEHGAPLSVADRDWFRPVNVAFKRLVTNHGVRIYEMVVEETMRRLKVWRGAKLKWRCWLVALFEEEIDIDKFVPPALIRQSKQWVAANPWVVLELTLAYYTQVTH